MTEPQTSSQINGPQVGSIEAIPTNDAREAYEALKSENAELKAKLAAFEEAMQRERGPKWEAGLNDLASTLDYLAQTPYINSPRDLELAAAQLRYMARCFTLKANLVPSELRIKELEARLSQFKEAMQREKQTEWHAEVKSQADWLWELSETESRDSFKNRMRECSILLNNLWQCYTHRANFVPIHLAIKEAHWLLISGEPGIAHGWLDRYEKWLKEVEGGL